MNSRPYHDSVLKTDSIIDFLNERYDGHLRLEHHGRTITASLTGPDAEIVLSSLDPIRAQLVLELQRVAGFYNWLALLLTEDDWCEAERDADEAAEMMAFHYGHPAIEEVAEKVAAWSELAESA